VEDDSSEVAVRSHVLGDTGILCTQKWTERIDVEGWDVFRADMRGDWSPSWLNGGRLVLPTLVKLAELSLYLSLDRFFSGP
jgi:hypothetical protein